MTRIPRRGDIVSLNDKRFLVTEVREGKVYSAKRLQTTFIAFDHRDSIAIRHDAIRGAMKGHLPIELIDVVLQVPGRGDVGYGHEQDLRDAESITITYIRK